MRDEELSTTDLCGLLQREDAAIRRALPVGVRRLLWPRAPKASTVSPVVAQVVIKEGSPTRWAAALALAASIFGVVWVSNHARLPALFWVSTQARHPASSQSSSALVGAANRMAPEELSGSDFVKYRLPNDVELNIPENGVESKLLMFIQNPGVTANGTKRFDCDRLGFDTGSATLRPESEEQLSNLAAILLAYPNVHVKIGGYTDSLDDSGVNSQLSRQRAKSVMAELVHRGVSPDQLTIEGHGMQSQRADHLTQGGRARNRGVSVRITKK